MEVETVYRCQFEFNFEREDELECFEKVEKIAKDIKRRYNVYINSDKGGPTWAYYYRIEGENKALVTQCSQCLINAIKRFKNHVIYD